MSRHKLWVKFDSIKRLTLLKNEDKLITLRFIKINKSLPFSKKYLASYYTSNLTKYHARTQISNRCIFSGRV